jgi:hypothetical protein
MRPNIDVPWSLHGRVKDHANSNDLDIVFPLGRNVHVKDGKRLSIR